MGVLILDIWALSCLAMHVSILLHLNKHSLIIRRHYKCWKVTGLFPWAALLFVVGYILREVGAFHYSIINIYIASQVFIYCAPSVLPCPSLHASLT